MLYNTTFSETSQIPILLFLALTDTDTCIFVEFVIFSYIWYSLYSQYILFVAPLYLGKELVGISRNVTGLPVCLTLHIGQA